MNNPLKDTAKTAQDMGKKITHMAEDQFNLTMELWRNNAEIGFRGLRALGDAQTPEQVRNAGIVLSQGAREMAGNTMSYVQDVFTGMRKTAQESGETIRKSGTKGSKE